jgi:type IV pilus assembly protein PilQ
VRWLLVVAVLGAFSSVAWADHDPCARGAKFRGNPIDLDVKDADVQDVFRLLSDAGRVNIVLADDVRGGVTARLRRVPWDQALCAVAATKRLSVTASGNVYLIRPR